jgi:transposase
MLRRGEITDQAWHHIEALLPRYSQSARQWRDHRQIVNGILWKLRTGSPWRDLPERYGPWQRPASIARLTAGATWSRGA